MSHVINQQEMTFITSVKNGCVAEVMAHLADWDVDADLTFRKHRIVHFMSVFIIDSYGERVSSSQVGLESGAQLVVDINHDGDSKAACDDLWSQNGEFFIRLLSRCECESLDRNSASDDLYRILRNHTPGQVCFVGARGMSVQEILRNEDLRRQASEAAQAQIAKNAGNDVPLDERELCKRLAEHLNGLGILGLQDYTRPFSVRHGAELWAMARQGMFMFLGLLILIACGLWGSSAAVPAESAVRAGSPSVECAGPGPRRASAVSAIGTGDNPTQNVKSPVVNTDDCKPPKPERFGTTLLLQFVLFVLAIASLGLLFWLETLNKVARWIVGGLLEGLISLQIRVHKPASLSLTRAREQLYLKPHEHPDTMWTRDDAVAGLKRVVKLEEIRSGMSALFVLLITVAMLFLTAGNTPGEAFGFTGNIRYYIVALLYLSAWLLIISVVFCKQPDWAQSETYILGFTTSAAIGMILLLSVAWLNPIDQFLVNTAMTLLGLLGLLIISGLFLYGLKSRSIHRWSVIALSAFTLYGLTHEVIEPQTASLFALVLLIFILLAVVFVQHMCWLRANERLDKEGPLSWEKSEVRSRILSRESRSQNGISQLISITTIRPHWRRRATLTVVMLYFQFLVKNVLNRGKLSGIETIYFARWVKIDNGKRLMFISHYYGDWDRYLDEYIDHGSVGLTGIWSNTIGFPRSEWLTGAGARNEQEFKAFARRSQVPSLFTYCAYPGVSVIQIQDNLYLRDLLTKANRSDAECAALLDML